MSNTQKPYKTIAEQQAFFEDLAQKQALLEVELERLKEQEQKWIEFQNWLKFKKVRVDHWKSAEDKRRKEYTKKCTEKLENLKAKYPRLNWKIWENHAHDKLAKTTESISWLAQLLVTKTITKCNFDAQMILHPKISSTDYSRGAMLHLPGPFISLLKDLLQNSKDIEVQQANTFVESLDKSICVQLNLWKQWLDAECVKHTLALNSKTMLPSSNAKNDDDDDDDDRTWWQKFTGVPRM